MMASLSTGKGVIQPVHIDDVLPEVVDRVECRNQGLEKSRALMTGIDELDAKTGGMEPGDLVFIAARPSMGKTELALDIIDKVTEQGMACFCSPWRWRTFRLVNVWCLLPGNAGIPS